jgi:hypothetical protein
MDRRIFGGLDGRSKMIRRARRIVIGSSMLSAASFSPMIVAIGLDTIAHRRLVEPWELLSMFAWAPAIGALLSWWVMSRTLPVQLAIDHDASAVSAPSAAAAIVRASLAGAVYPVLFFVPFSIFLASTDLSGALVLPALVLVTGAIPGALAGAMCGLALAAGIHVLREHVVSPAHDLIEHAYWAAASLCAFGAVVSMLPIAALEGMYCTTLLLVIAPALGIAPPPGTDLAWTRYVVLIAPSVAAAIVLAARAWIDRRRRARLVDALRAGAHVDLALGDARTIGEGVLPLRAQDRGASIARPIVERAGSVPYRETSPPLAFLAEGT